MTDNAATITPAKRVVTHIGNALFGLIMVFMIIVVFSLIQSKRTGEVPKFFGYQSYIVLSGSMVPAFNPGSMILVKPVNPANLVVGDIITFKGSSEDVSTTHRIVDIIQGDELAFVTKGDANNVSDPNPVPAKNVIGKVTMAMPYAGYIMDFARTKSGLFALVVLPGVMIIVSELRKLYQYAVELDRQAEAKKKQQGAEQVGA